MCIDAIVNGATVETQGELEKLMPNGLVFLDGYKLQIVPDQCLCPVDFEATAKINGMNVMRHDWSEDWSGEVELMDELGDTKHESDARGIMGDYYSAREGKD